MLPAPVRPMLVCSALLCCTCIAWAAPQPQPQRILLEVLEPADRAALRAFPVAVGLTFPQGQLAAAPGGRLVDDENQPVPFEAQATAWWGPEQRNVRWLLLRFKADTQRRYFFEPGPAGASVGGAPLAQQQEDGQIRVQTGPLQARLAPQAGLITELLLNGKPLLKRPGLACNLILDTGKAGRATRLDNWTLTLEQSTPLHASIKASALHYNTDGAAFATPVARTDLRLEFFRGESFIRLYHTVTWMGLNPNQRVREWSVSLTPQLGAAGQVQIGVDGDADWQGSFDAQTQLFAQQQDAERYTLNAADKVVQEGRRIDGSMTLRNDAGQGVAVTLRHAWQTFPTALELNKGRLSVQMWPPRGEHMSMTPMGIQGKEIFFHPAWKFFAWSREEEHFVHERARQDWFFHTPQGAARTHEMTLHFFDAAGRPPEQVRDVTHRPVIVRQDPRWALQVPFMGLRLAPYQPEKFPHVERAIDVLGRLSMGRWAQVHELGFWKFGFTRWGRPYTSDAGRSMYRWMDGAQYDQQLIPWLLFLRGGGREWHEQAEITSRMLMDVGVNHYSTRGFPTGFMATAGGTPFPYVPYHTTKGTKVHFLSCYYHLTGYRRAKEVMDTVIAGAVATAEQNQEELPPWYRRTGGREAYNMNVFWVNAYQETFDPQVKTFADEWRDIAVNREYSAELNYFRPPQIYLYNGLVLQHRLSKDSQLAQVMLRNLGANVLSAVDEGGVRQVEYLVAAQWAYEQTRDPRWVQVAWDVARSLADCTPDADTAGPMPPSYAMTGNSIYRQYLMPILVGLSLADEHGLDERAPLVRDDTFVSVQPSAAHGGAAALVRARNAQPLVLRVRLVATPAQPVSVALVDAQGRRLAEADLSQGRRETATLEGPGYGVAVNLAPDVPLRLEQPQTQQVYRLVFEGALKNVMALVQGDADIVHHVAPAESLTVQDLAGQYFTGTRFVVRAAEDVITVTTNSPPRSPYTIRDARSGEILFCSNADQDQRQEHHVGAGRLLMFTVGGHASWTRRTIQGIDPWLASTADRWFMPEQRKTESAP